MDLKSWITLLKDLMVTKYACLCCGYKTFNHEPNGSYEICPVCFWEDDPIQLNDPEYEDGAANPMSLGQAQQNFLDLRYVTGKCYQTQENLTQTKSGMTIGNHLKKYSSTKMMIVIKYTI